MDSDTDVIYNVRRTWNPNICSKENVLLEFFPEHVCEHICYYLDIHERQMRKKLFRIQMLEKRGYKPFKRVGLNNSVEDIEMVYQAGLEEHRSIQKRLEQERHKKMAMHLVEDCMHRIETGDEYDPERLRGELALLTIGESCRQM